MKFKEVTFLELSSTARKDALRQMADIARGEDYLEAETGEDVAHLIVDEGYNPDRDFYFVLFEDGDVRVRSKSAQ